ncbi:MAG TPA: nucleoside triphosphate pyrophosphatase [Solirubrobacteraceae bacterium]|nr:nucleoside triphosphate pyrophosphatase [Solirubrobacteraceae bacterium]
MSERPPLVLASASPQRRAILARLGIAFEVRPSGVPELVEGEPAAVAVGNALRKARAVRDSHCEALVLGVDTLVELDGRIYGKPAGEREARETLQALGGATHTVVSGLALLDGADERTAVACTRVSFRELTPGMIDWYVAGGEWRERAGGYAIQGAGAALVREIVGDYENVVGLPLATLLDLRPDLI